MSNPNATIDTLIEDTMQFREFDDGMIYYTKLNAYSVLYTLYGKNVLDFIYYSLDVRASDQLTYTNEINKLLFEKIFENKYRFSFNQRIIIEKKDMINNLIALKKQGYPIEELLHKKKTSAKKIYHYEIDAQFSLSSLDEPIIRFENKLFTSPHQKGEILQKHLGKSFLEKLFSIRDFLGLITFATVVDANQPEKLFEFPNEIKENHRTGWFLHFIVIDRNILHSKKRAETHASECIASIKNHNDFFKEKLGLNRYPCSIRLIENYVKVVYLNYMLEIYKKEVEEMREKLKEVDALKKMKKEEEKKRREEEKKRRELEQKNSILIELLKKQGLTEEQIKNELEKK